MRMDFWDFGYDDSATITWGQMLPYLLAVVAVGFIALAIYKRRR